MTPFLVCQSQLCQLSLLKGMTCLGLISQKIDTIYKIDCLLYILQPFNYQYLLAMSAFFWMIVVVLIFASIVYLTQAKTAKVSTLGKQETKVGSLQWWEKQLKVIKKKRNEHLTKLYKSNNYNFAIYAPEDDILVIGQNSQLKQVQYSIHFTRNTIKDDKWIKTAQRLSEYRQIDPELRRLHFESHVKFAIVEILRSQSHQKTYEEYLQQNQNLFFLSSGWVKIAEDPKEHLFLQEVAKKAKEEYLKVRQERQRQTELIHLLAKMKELKAADNEDGSLQAAHQERRLLHQ